MRRGEVGIKCTVCTVDREFFERYLCSLLAALLRYPWAMGEQQRQDSGVGYQESAWTADVPQARCRN